MRIQTIVCRYASRGGLSAGSSEPVETENSQRASDVFQSMDVALGEVWEMYSAGAGQWVRVVVTKVEDGEVTLRYEGVLEFLTVDGSDLQNPELFRSV